MRRWQPVTGMTVASSLGNTVAELTEGLFAQKRAFTLNHRFAHVFPKPLAEVEPGGFSFMAPRLGKSDSFLTRMVLGSLERLIQESGVFSRHRRSRVGFFFGTTTAGVETSLEPLVGYGTSGPGARLTDFLDRTHQHGIFETLVRMHLGFEGPTFTFATACSSAATALAEAALAVASGMVDAAIAGGMDVHNLMTLHGFDALQIVSPEPTEPFSPTSRGITLGEGGGFLLLESASTTGLPAPLGWLAGWGGASDAHHITQPDPTGKGMALSMARALSCAQIEPGDVRYVNAHGTGTRANDEAESKAIATLFGNEMHASSTKGFHGHALGGSGGIEAVVSLLALAHGLPWPGVGNPFPSKTRDGLGFVLSNSFGFGGSNASLVFAHGRLSP